VRVADRSSVLTEARTAFERHDWQVAVERYRAADALEPLAPADLESFAAASSRAESSGWNALLERAYGAYDEVGDARGAARMALELARNHVLVGETNRGVGWWLRAGRLLETEGECGERGLLLWMESRAYMAEGDLARGEELAREATAVGLRCGNRDVEALGLLDQGHYRLVAGDLGNALALLDEATSLALTPAVAPPTAGGVMCGMIWACRYLGDWRRASDWTDISVEFCDREAGGYYPGLCRVHRAEVVRVRGDYDDAERDVLAACEQLLSRNRNAAAWAYQELGEIRFRRGDLAGAENAFHEARAHGLEPQPGLARLQQSRGDLTGALHSLERALREETLNDAENRPFLLPELVAIACAASDLATARRGLAEMEALGSIIEGAAHRAALEGARGRVALLEGRPDDAAVALRGAIRSWCAIDAPYEAAHARVALADAYEAVSNTSDSRLERETALATFERLGATRDVGLLRAVLDQSNQQQVARTFMFTDIVGSTKMLDAIGDEAWNTLLQWHDRTMRGCFVGHAGEEIKHEGDGFFVAFPSASEALECGIEIQRLLAEHRRQHGFAPSVRIGVHTASATRYGRDYIGRGVHETARIAAAGGAGEILVSETTIEGLKVAVGERRTLRLKGLPDPVEVAVIDWA
jgi:class 3 adenylate cyclase